jgi:transcriptional regulator with GAF, ATPase, and Fis domain
MKKWGLAILGLLLLIYGLVVIAYAHQTIEIGLRCAFDTTVQATYPDHLPDEYTMDGRKPQDGDHLLEIAGYRIENWSDYLRALASLRSLHPKVIIESATVQDLAEWAKQREYVVTLGKHTLVNVKFSTPEGKETQAWVMAGAPHPSEFLPSLSWFLIKLGLLLVGATVFWKRSDDPVAVQFFLLCICNVGAFMGGYHWLRIAMEPWLVGIFMICAVLLPPVSLHFYLIFPRSKVFLERYKGWGLTLLYGPSLIILVVMLATLIGTITVHRLGRDPELVKELLGFQLSTIYVAVGLAALQFAGCIASLAHSFWASAKGSQERQQVKWILGGATFAAIPIIYTLRLAATDPESFGLGGATWPMFLASLSITLAYGVGISRYGFLDMGELINRSILPLVVSLAVGLAYALIVFIGMLILGDSGMGGMFSAPLQQATWVSITALVMLTVLDLARSRIRSVLDRRLIKTKILLDQTLKRMSLTVEQQLETPILCKRFLNAVAELIDIDEGSVYLRAGDGSAYRLVAQLDTSTKQVTELPSNTPLIAALQQLPMVRLRHGSTISPEPAQKQLRELGSELALPLRYESTLLAVLLIGHREEGGIDITTLHLLTTFAQIAGMALHGAEGHAAMESLNRELQDKVQKISEQQRRIVTLQSQLLQLGAAKSNQNGGPQVTAQTPSKDPVSLPPVEGIIGSSQIMRHLLASVKKVAQSQSAVLIRGESGTGKELIAKALHDGSLRSKGPFVKVHCAALAPGLLESELFGHVKGAFTGAIKDKPGRFEMADKGTLFLDEIGDISLDVQTKLLRVLQEMTFERVGSSTPISVDVRIIAATNQDLEKLMKEGRFREDLFFRLNVITMRTPGLRERPEDILELVDHFVRTYAAKSNKPIPSFDDDAAAALKAYSWPGNVRELENAIERAVVLADGPMITPTELPEEIASARTGILPLTANGNQSESWNIAEPDWSTRFEQEERRRLIHAMTKAAGNKSEAARMLGLPRSTLMSKLEKHGLLSKRSV